MTARVYDNWFKEWEFRYGAASGPHAFTASPDDKVRVTVYSWQELHFSVSIDGRDKYFEVAWPTDELDELKVACRLLLGKLEYDGILTHLQFEMEEAGVLAKLSAAKVFRYAGGA